MPRSDEHETADAVGDQRDTAQDERAHQDLAQLRVALHEHPQMVPTDDDHRAVGDGAAANKRAARRQHVDLTRELAGTQRRDRLLAAVDGPNDLDGALDHHEEARVLLAELEQPIAGAHLTALADTPDALELRRRQPGKHFGSAVDVGITHH